MNSSNYMALCLGLILLISLSQAKYYRIHPNYGFDWVRGKRQSHPDVTQARLPLVPFQSSPPAELPSSLVPLEYLTPPAIDAPIGDQPSSTSQTTTPPPAQIPVQRGEKWELGYDAGDLLVPPLQDEQSTDYNSLKFQLSNTPLEVITASSPKLIPGEILPFEQEIAASEVSGRINGKFGGSFDEPNYQIDNRHVHSFVKTDPHGHFKWGVHIGH
ncbi:uncharacterized protein isoform X2 [Rhodnius prolixus]|uniref:uncharacterized protein isoform X2 n=1 Tax=Rhodnius prolixus TaxID=13249 RepID=UPI003D18F65C